MKVKYKLNDKSKGITLIALVITIIILLILASISIVTLTGDNGLIQKAVDARDKSKLAEQKERIETIVTSCFGRNGDIKYDKLKDELEKIGATVQDNNYPINVDLNGNKFEIDEKGNVLINEIASLDEIEITYNNQNLIGLSDNNSFTSFEIPKTCEENGKKYRITSLGYNFCYNTELDYIKIPNTVRNLNEAAFCWAGIKEVYIPKSVTGFGEGVFSYCNELQSFHVDEDNPVIKDIDGVAFTKSGKTLIAYPASKSEIKCTIPSGTEAIGSYAFYNSKNLKEVEIPNTVKRIKYNAFEYCEKIERIVIPNNVEEIEMGAFSDCENLVTVSLPSNLTMIPDCAFFYCRKLQNVQIPSSVTEIGYSAFSHADGLGTIQIPANVSKIGEGAFELANATINFSNYRNIKEVGDSAFYNCNMNSDAKNYIMSLNPNAFELNDYAFGSVMGYTFAEQ